jgi:thiol-disulfide isomerase/thioredoxin
MTGVRRLTAVRALVMFLVLAVAGVASAESLKVGDHMAELDVAVDARSKPFKLKAYKGKWVLVTAGASWCKPCKKELPTWDKVAGELKGKITFVALDLDNDIKDGKKFHKKLGLKHMVRVYMPEEKSSVAGRYGAATMPSTFVIGPKGLVRYVHHGFDDRDASGESKKLKAKLSKLIKK